MNFKLIAAISAISSSVVIAAAAAIAQVDEIKPPYDLKPYTQLDAEFEGLYTGEWYERGIFTRLALENCMETVDCKPLATSLETALPARRDGLKLGAVYLPEDVSYFPPAPKVTYLCPSSTSGLIELHEDNSATSIDDMAFMPNEIIVVVPCSYLRDVHNQVK